MPPVDPSHYLHWTALGLSPVALEIPAFTLFGHAIGPFDIRWYSLAYITGILVGWWYVLKLIARPGAPMARRHADDFVFWATLGVLLGGRLGYVIFYGQGYYWQHPADIVKLWDGGMSFHGGAFGVTMAILFFCRQNRLRFLRVCDYIACATPIGLFFGRLANFVNGELWGDRTSVPWAIVFPTGGDVPRHPSELYEAGLEGIALFLILNLLFWRSPNARFRPGFLTGVFLIGYGAFRFLVEFVRAPDAQLVGFSQATGLHMGQWLDLPMLALGGYLVATSSRRRRAAEPVIGNEAVA